jgi:hypothetical protein
MSTATSTPTGAGAVRAGTTATLTGERVWRELAKASFAIISHLTPTGQPRSSGVLYTVADRRMYVVVGADSWKARHIAANGQVAVTVPVRRGGIMSLLFPIPPAAISFHASAVVHPVGPLEGTQMGARLAALLPTERVSSARVIEIVPEGRFVTYGVGVSLMRMRDPARARGSAPVA